MLLADPVRPERVAVVDSLLRARVNWELYYFADLKTLKKFRKHPERYTGLVTDPVRLVRFMPSKDSPCLEWQGALYFFATDSSRTQFNRSPLAYSRVR